MNIVAENAVPTVEELSQIWDVIIIGAGIGGSTVGYDLSSRGFSVLFLEKGGRVPSGIEPRETIDPEERIASGWWPHPISEQTENGSRNRFYVAIGCAVGGSSIHFAAALERLDRSDFDALETPRLNLPPWPVSYEEFLPYYEAAEALYRVNSGSLDESTALLSEWDLGLIETLRRNGLCPRRLQVGMRYDRDCSECVGRICPRGCKSDARTICIESALRRANCRMLDRCDVKMLEADGSSVRSVKAERSGRTFEVRARAIVLAAGGIHSPKLLLESRNAFWPDGLANRSGLVGRNLMFHTIDLYGLWAPRRLDREGRQRKATLIRDFYLQDGVRLGAVQSAGLDASRGNIAAYLKDLLRSRGIRNEKLLSLLAVIPSHVAAALLGTAGILAANTEDDPDPDNRVVLDPDEPDGISFRYSITPDLRERAERLRRVFSEHVKPWKLLRLTPELRMNYGHPCGTCRFGNDPVTSVLNRDCRAHDVDNLYVVDSSFMPRSGAVMPSLTIAANALRVAPRIASMLSSR